MMDLSQLNLSGFKIKPLFPNFGKINVNGFVVCNQIIGQKRPFSYITSVSLAIFVPLKSHESFQFHYRNHR